MLNVLAVEGYRSLRRLILPLGRLNVVTGANGSGKSSLYRALRLLADSARSGAVAALAREGGLQSTMWAGPATVSRAVREGRQPVQGTVATGPASLKLGFGADDFGYAVDLGLPVSNGPVAESAFALDPEIKVEAVWAGPVLRPSAVLAQRHGSTVQLRDADGGRHRLLEVLRPFDSMLGELADPRHAPELMQLRERVRAWRFYDHLRTDAAAPARLPQIGTRTAVLAHDGADLPAALQTIREIGDHEALDTAVDLAFPGSRLEVGTDGGRFELRLRQPGMLRPLTAAELSDGTLRYLLLAAALLTPRPPQLMVLNEPETSLHPDLLPALARLVVEAAGHSQIVLVSHSRALMAALDRAETEVNAVELVKELGQTTVEGQGRLDEPLWHWPARS
ncbi:AAA family ATPase [Catellatospora sp. KI3]|uniref:AAA family ATPase n=1 Tax=Catellatospora sp. KI3 TaxID=3041620 RepID=UPI002482B7F2|nr:AAA family ATPase [Catellatospora sp. KI3]MDI1466101.1 AAA family ATPase [Catellatospora sp. KI3]